MNEDLGNSSRDILTAGVEELKKLDTSEIYPRKLNTKEVLMSLKDDEFEILVIVLQKLSGRDYKFQEPTLRRESVRRKNLDG